MNQTKALKLNKSTRVAVFTFGRSDFGLLRNLILELEKRKNFEVHVIAAGSHFLEKFGNSIDEVRRDNNWNLIEVDCISGSSDSLEVVQDMAESLSRIGSVLASLTPDLVVILGDRFEALTAASAALVLRIPIAHINGGELTLGAFDDAIRHSITKMSSVHFVANETYRTRVLQLGEECSRVHNVGHLAADSLIGLDPYTQSQIEGLIGFEFREYNFLVTLHPETATKTEPAELTLATLEALGRFPDAGIVFTSPNQDPGHSTISKLISDFVSTRDNCVVLQAMGHKAYLSSMLLNTVVVGNSSSGVLEAPLAGAPSVNIGLRQQGRISTDSIENCLVDSEDIYNALQLSIRKLSPNRQSWQGTVRKASVSYAISEIIGNLRLEGLETKSFQDLPMTQA